MPSSIFFSLLLGLFRFTSSSGQNDRIAARQEGTFGLYKASDTWASDIQTMSNEDDGGWGGPPDDAPAQPSGGGWGGPPDDAPAQPSGGGWGDAPVSAGFGGDSQNAGGYGGGGGGGGCFKCGQDGHFARECPNAEQFGSECYRCHKRGHFARECPESGGGGGQECFKCNQVGHISRDCPSAFGARDNGYAQRGQSQRSFGGSQAGSASVQQSQPTDSWGNDNAQPASGGLRAWGDSAPAQESNDADDGGWGSAPATPVDWSVPPPRTYPPAKDLHLGQIDADRDGGIGIHVSSLTTGRPWEKQFVPPSVDQGWGGFKRRGGSKSGSQAGRSERGSQYGGGGGGGFDAASGGGRFGGPSGGGWGGDAPQQSNDSWGAPASAPQAPAGGESRWSAAPEPASTNSNDDDDDDAGGWGATPAVIRAPAPASEPSAQHSSSFAEEPATTPTSAQQSTSWADDISPEPQAEAEEAGGWGAEPASSAPAASGGGGGWGDDTPAPSGGGGGWGDDTPAPSGGGVALGTTPMAVVVEAEEEAGDASNVDKTVTLLENAPVLVVPDEQAAVMAASNVANKATFPENAPTGLIKVEASVTDVTNAVISPESAPTVEVMAASSVANKDTFPENAPTGLVKVEASVTDVTNASRECPNGGGGGGYGNSGPRYSGFGAPVTGTNSVSLSTAGEVTGWGARKAFLAQESEHGSNTGWGGRPKPAAPPPVESNWGGAPVATDDGNGDAGGWGAPVATDDGDDDAGGWGAPTPKAGNTNLPTEDAGGWGEAAPAPAANNGGGWNAISPQAGKQASDSQSSFGGSNSQRSTGPRQPWSERRHLQQAPGGFDQSSNGFDQSGFNQGFGGGAARSNWGNEGRADQPGKWGHDGFEDLQRDNQSKGSRGSRGPPRAFHLQQINALLQNQATAQQRAPGGFGGSNGQHDNGYGARSSSQASRGGSAGGGDWGGQSASGPAQSSGEDAGGWGDSTDMPDLEGLKISDSGVPDQAAEEDFGGW
ncbi:hypothetical protein B9479_006336 [Cryptococcus floricola]|uniref:CCHC-type domain-containing protein n=1 Tax=Cryptococcus floricola TaxID=2591691 RepID=A0A5D3ATI2_9TREE|nr:hypothetical protein B9479_006336 [Cryptococcus floricola]